MAAVAVVEEVQVDSVATVLPQCGGKAFGIAGEACTLVDCRAGVKDDPQTSRQLPGTRGWGMG